MRAQTALLCSICAVSQVALSAVVFDEAVSLPELTPSIQEKALQVDHSLQNAELLARPMQSNFFALPPSGHAQTEISASVSSRHRALRLNEYQYDPNMGTPMNKTQTDTTEATEFAVSTTYGFAERSFFGVDVGYANSSYQVDGAAADRSGGLRDIAFNLGRVSASRHFVYGIGATLSPSTARPAQGWQGIGNSFSGQHVLHPFVGYETARTNALFGAKFAVHVPFAEVRPEGLQAASASGSFDLTGFYEFPIIKNLTFGAAVALNGNESILSDSWAERAFVARAYTNAKLLDDTEAKIAVEGVSTQLTSGNATETRVSVGLLKTL
jgi:hypothetical protein